MSTSAMDKAVASWIPGALFGLVGAADYLWDGAVSPNGVLLLAYSAMLIVIPAALLLALENEDRRWRRVESRRPANLDQMRDSTVPTILERTTSASPK